MNTRPTPGRRAAGDELPFEVLDSRRLGGGSHGTLYLLVVAEQVCRQLASRLGDNFDLESCPIYGRRDYQFVLKIPRQDHHPGLDTRQRLRREATLLRRANAKGCLVPRFLGGELSDETTAPWLAMTEVYGVSLADALRSVGTLDDRRVIGFASGLWHAVDGLRQAGIVHRDLAPDNIFFLLDASHAPQFSYPQLIDLSAGWTPTVEEFTDSDGNLRPSSDPAHEEFRAPEQLLEAPDRWPRGTLAAEAAIDIFQWALVVYRAYSGGPIFVERRRGDRSARLFELRDYLLGAIDLPDRVGHLPPPLAEAARIALSLEPHERDPAAISALLPPVDPAAVHDLVAVLQGKIALAQTTIDSHHDTLDDPAGNAQTQADLEKDLADRDAEIAELHRSLSVARNALAAAENRVGQVEAMEELVATLADPSTPPTSATSSANRPARMAAAIVAALVLVAALTYLGRLWTNHDSDSTAAPAPATTLTDPPSSADAVDTSTSARPATTTTTQPPSTTTTSTATSSTTTTTVPLLDREAVDLVDYPQMHDGGFWPTGPARVNGEPLEDVFVEPGTRSQCPNGNQPDEYEEHRFDLAGRWSTFEFAVQPDDLSPTDFAQQVVVFLDGDKNKSGINLSMLEPVSYGERFERSVDVSGVQQLAVTIGAHCNMPGEEEGDMVWLWARVTK